MYEDILLTLQFSLIYEVYNIEDYFITLEEPIIWYRKEKKRAMVFGSEVEGNRMPLSLSV